MKTKRKRLFFDIETSPNIGFFWKSGHEISVGDHNIIKERAIITICYKWAGERKVYALTWDAKQNDKTMLKKFIKVFNEADEVVSHNGDRFDITWVRTRCILHGINMMPNPISIDTLKAARRHFNFNSNKLDYIAKYLGFNGKVDTGGFDLWKDIVLKRSKTALAKMVRYCKHDVVLLEKVYDKMNSYLLARTSIAGTTRECPECQGEARVNKYRVTAAGYKKVQLQCKDCGKYHTIARSRYEKEKVI